MDPVYENVYLAPDAIVFSRLPRYLKTVPLNFVVNTVLYYYCVYYEI